ncbi:TonB C-terminal domain-containing protein [Helicobacter brantae]|uniref:TonB C-terminal domain-containing protein n=1 Tax=Helicobacter brantae TaxID=375927 RepID=A0A3D8J1Z6_9HELI|nr:TonB C-terminal domain-containing protein [Helicobacter brantae]RDU71175.1 hypothetical protein CQA58_03415 [Helicobacter brantae]
MNARFLWSGIVAFCLEALLFVGLFFALLPKPKELYTAKDKTQLEFIQIDQILSEVPKQKEKSIQKPIEKPINKPKEEPQIKEAQKEVKKPEVKIQEVVKTPKQEEIKPLPPKEQKAKTPQIKEIFSSPVAGSGVKSLFEKVDSSNPPIKEEDEVYDDRPLFSANSIQSKNYAYSQSNSQELAKETSKLKNTLEQIWEKELEIKSSPPQDLSDGKYDEWFAKVKNILYAKWDNHFYESVSIVVYITITNQGKFSYRIIKKSKNSSYNTYMQNLLETLRQESFPPYPKGDQKSIEVTFKTKEQGNV